MTIIIMQANYCSAGCASDDMKIPPPKLPNMDLMKEQQISPPKVSVKLPDESLKGPETIQLEQQVEQKIQPAEKPQKVEKPLPPQPKKGNGFISALFNMFAVLIKVVLLLGLVYGGILLYKRFKEQQPAPSAEQEEIPGMPRTVSEAVSSYVKHRIKKSI